MIESRIVWGYSMVLYMNTNNATMLVKYLVDC
jgi:hypothetical protein